MTHKDCFQEFESKIGGSWAISWQVYAVSAPVAFIAVVGSTSKALDTREQMLLVCLTGVATLLVLGLILMLFDKTIFRNRHTRPVPLGWSFFVGLVTGAVFTGGIVMAQLLVGLSITSDWFAKFLSNAALITWWGMTFTLVLVNRDVFARQRTAAIADAIELEMVSMRGSETEDRLRNSLNKKISHEISEARSALNAALKSAQSEPSDLKWQPLAQQMRNIASDVMRPLSKKLWQSAGAVFPRPSIYQVLKTIISKQPLRPVAMTLIVLLLSTQTLLANFGTLVGSVVLFATVAFVWLVMPLANLGASRRPHLRAYYFWLTVLSFQIFDTFAWMWAGKSAHVAVSFGTLALNIVASLILILLTSGFGAYGNLNEKSLQDFRQEMSKRELQTLLHNRVVASLALDAARNLHGRVQTRLISCAAAVERAEITADIELLNRALIEVNEIFDAAALTDSADISMSLDESLAEAIRPWQGFCATTLAVDPKLSHLNSKIASDVAEVVEEAVTNAVRHGGATRVKVRVKHVRQSISVQVSDNGSGFAEGGSGVGTELIRLVSRGNFSFSKNVSGGVDLQLSIPVTGC